MNAVLLSTAYLPPISYFSQLCRTGSVIFEKHEHYIKQSYRNRALVYGANGIHPLIIPVHHEGNERKPIWERKVSHDSQWQKIHWRTLVSSYRNAPYFEYFEDDFRIFYETETDTLFDFNFRLISKIAALIQLPFNPEFTTSYEPQYADTDDLRDYFNPSARRENLPTYNQVFGDRYGFTSDLSIVDLLFNKGLETKNYLAEITS